MIVHLTPCILNRYLDVNVSLVDIEIPELNLTLVGNVDASVGNPYPNKSIHVAYQMGKTRKALNGLIVEIPEHLDCFSLITRWLLDNELLASHTVNFKIADRDYNAATQDPVLWYATGDNSQEDRWPCEQQNPCYFMPRFEVLFSGDTCSKTGDFSDYFENGRLVARTENYLIPTIKLSHLYGLYNPHLDRMPDVKNPIKQSISE